MKITWYGTAALRLDSGQGRVLIDPFVRKYGDASDKIKRIFQREKVIMITHGHFDHISHIYKIFGKREDLQIYGTRTPIASLLRDGIVKKAVHIVGPGDSFCLEGFSIRVFPGKHVEFDRKLVLKTAFSMRTLRYFSDAITELIQWKRYAEKKEILFLEFQADGKRVQVMGSAALAEDCMYPQNADLLALAYQGKSNLPEYIQNIIRRLRPKCIMPIHFDDAFPPISSEVDMMAFEEMMKKQFPDIKLMIPQLDVTYEV